MYRLICQKQVHFLSAQMALVSTFFQMFIVLWIYNFGNNVQHLIRWSTFAQAFGCWIKWFQTPCGNWQLHFGSKHHYVNYYCPTTTRNIWNDADDSLDILRSVYPLERLQDIPTLDFSTPNFNPDFSSLDFTTMNSSTPDHYYTVTFFFI